MINAILTYLNIWFCRNRRLLAFRVEYPIDSRTQSGERRTARVGYDEAIGLQANFGGQIYLDPMPYLVKESDKEHLCAVCLTDCDCGGNKDACNFCSGCQAEQRESEAND